LIIQRGEGGGAEKAGGTCGDIIFTKLNPLSWHMRMNEKVAIKIISLHFVGFFGQLFFSLFYTVFFFLLETGNFLFQ
jgi:hypothetical protein